ncbi:MAG: lactate racemase domain-containing protein [Pyrinomonadaceae bacterium]
MFNQTAEIALGCGTAIGRLSSDDMRAIVEEALEPIPAGARVLAVIPDKTRDDNTNVLFPMAAQILQGRRVAAFDALVAQGTHTPMTRRAKRWQKIGGEGLTGVGQVFDHRWDDPEEISMIGALSADQVTRLTGGAFQESVPVSINRLIASGEYDFILLFTATVPHEVVGFAGGAKYFFPASPAPSLHT